MMQDADNQLPQRCEIRGSVIVSIDHRQVHRMRALEGRKEPRSLTKLWQWAGIRRLVVPVVLIAMWCVVSYGGLISSLYVPSPSQMWVSFELMRPRLPGAIATSVVMTLTGFILGSTLGIVSGLSLAYSKTLRQLFGDVMDLSRPVPVFALIPLFLLWFGTGRAPQIALITLGTSVIVGITTLDATRNVNPIHLRAAATLGASRWAQYRTVIVPSIFPHLLGALRFAATASWGLDVAAELMGSQNGLGYLMIVREQYLDTAGILVVVVIYGLLATVLDRVMVVAERPLTQWTHRNGPSSSLEPA